MTDHRTQELESRLARTLDERAEALQDAPFTVHDIRGRARSIRRRRRGVAACAAAAVAAVALPVALLAGPGEDRSDRAVDPAGPPVSPSAAVLHDGVVTLPDGGTVALPPDVGEVTELATLTDGRVVLMLPRRAVVLDPAGAEPTSYPVLVNDLTTGNEGRTVAWVGAEGQVQVLESDQSAPTDLARVPVDDLTLPTIEAVLGHSCAAGGCRVLVGDSNALTYDVSLDRASDATEDLWPFASISDVSPDGQLWAVELPPGPAEQFGCAALYEAVAGELVARTCETSGLRFSPDGRHLLGMRGDNNMSGEVVVLDLDLRPVLTFPDGTEPVASPSAGATSPPESEVVVSRAGWGDAGHLLVSTTDLSGRAWSLVRVPLDGSEPEVVDGPAPGGNPEMVEEYLLAE
ncbi:hypothetical protein [Nocardioides dongkuii]|uniref:hypothetical protein n=1 Tax=Nocardioides dongkuii TaxID=2760089 RepID=UPI0015FA79DA|nr:hypothetical protein [Nocardioides dongkuii]